MTEPLLSVRDLRVSFRTEEGPVIAVHGLSFDVGAGEVLSVVGESGSGKTVSLLSVLGLVDRRNTIVTGEVLFRGQPLLTLPERQMRRVRGGEIALISQDPMTAMTPRRARSPLRLGAIPPMPPIWMPIEEKLAKPHRA